MSRVLKNEKGIVSFAMPQPAVSLKTGGSPLGENTTVNSKRQGYDSILAGVQAGVHTESPNRCRSRGNMKSRDAFREMFALVRENKASLGL